MQCEDAPEGSATVRKTVMDIVQQMANERPPALRDDHSLRDDLRFDSLSLALLFFRLQEEFKLDVAAMRSALADVSTVASLVQSIEQLAPADLAGRL